MGPDRRAVDDDLIAGTRLQFAQAYLARRLGRAYGMRDPCGAPVRCNFQYVPQGNSLMSGTIRENLRMGAADADEAQMADALHTAAADFVLSLPEGLDTPCGETGSGLSEGQSQRIAIARALLRPGGILILDEATSALDIETEAVLLERLYDRCHGEKTILFISHREAAISKADDILHLAEQV